VLWYGIVTFDKENRTMKIECWPRHADPEKEPRGQFEGSPVTVSQEDNYGRKAIGYLPMLKVAGAKDPVIQVINEEGGEVQYTLRIKGNAFQPKVFSGGTHTVKVSHPETR
jgi:alkaline phosphatase D